MVVVSAAALGSTVLPTRAQLYALANPLCTMVRPVGCLFKGWHGSSRRAATSVLFWQDLTLNGFSATSLPVDYFTGFFTVFSLKLLNLGLESLPAATLQQMPFLQSLYVFPPPFCRGSREKSHRCGGGWNDL